MEQILWELIREQAAYIDYLESMLDSLKSDIDDMDSLLDGLKAKLEASGL